MLMLIGSVGERFSMSFVFMSSLFLSGLSLSLAVPSLDLC